LEKIRKEIKERNIPNNTFRGNMDVRKNTMQRECQEMDSHGECENGHQTEHEGREDPKKDGWMA
jgi:hypothetical protein